MLSLIISGLPPSNGRLNPAYSLKPMVTSNQLFMLPMSVSEKYGLFTKEFFHHERATYALAEARPGRKKHFPQKHAEEHSKRD